MMPMVTACKVYTLKDEFCSEESFVEKAISTLDKEKVGDLINKIIRRILKKV